MIKKLRFHFILNSLLSVFALLFVILGTINVVNYSLVANDADKVTQIIADNGGAFKEMEPPKEGSNPPAPVGPNSPETAMSTRYFTVKIVKDNDNYSYELFAYKIIALSQEECLEWGKSIYANKKNKTGWKEYTYRYRIYSDQEVKHVKYVTVIDQGREILPSQRVLLGSIIGGLSGTLIAFVILFFLSKLFFKPLEDSLRKQKRFIDDAASELKAPLSVISMNNDIIENSQGENEETKAIRKEIRDLTKLIWKLETLSKMENLKDEDLERKDIALSQSAIQLGEKYQDLFKKVHKELEIEVASDITYKGDELKMNQLFTILLDNAMKYSLTKAKLELFKEDERVVIRITNDGQDIQEGPLDIVFERFYRLESSKKGKIEGNGIGLSVAKEIVRLHKGRIYANGKDGEFIIKVEL